MTDGMPTARLRRSRGVALVWLVPLGALTLVVWLGVRTLWERGPMVTITFETAEGLEPGRTKVRYKAVEIGTVESVALADDLHHVIVKARMDRSTADALTGSTEFWIARPRLSPGGISGLSTIVSGAYLEFQPGQSGTPQYDFKGLEEPPIADPAVPGRRFTLHADRLGGLSQGAPVYYRGVVVGEVLGSHLDQKTDSVVILVFVRSPYTALVRTRTRFWNASGVSISAGPSGIKASVASLQALVAGGIEFGMIAADTDEAPSPAGTEFRLFADAASAEVEPFGASIRYLVRFPGAVHGMSDGDSVELRGRYVGKVDDIRLAYDPATRTLSTPAIIEIQPEKIDGFHPAAGQEAAATTALLQHLVDQGLRAHLASANLLTGQRLVALDVDPAARPATLSTEGSLPEIPVGSAGDLDDLTRSASQAMASIAAMPLQAIGEHLRDLIGHLDGLTGSPDARQALHRLDQTLASLNTLASSASTDLPPLLKRLDATADAATRTLDVLGGQGGRGTDLRGLLHELEEAARSLRALGDFLQEHPEALVKGRNDEAK